MNLLTIDILVQNATGHALFGKQLRSEPFGGVNEIHAELMLHDSRFQVGED